MILMVQWGGQRPSQAVARSPFWKERASSNVELETLHFERGSCQAHVVRSDLKWQLQFGRASAGAFRNR